MIRFDASKPFGRVFHGEGKPRKQDAVCVYFQDSLYFDADGALVKNDHNDGVLAQREKPVQLLEKPAEPMPDVSGQSDDVIFRMAINLSRKLAKAGEADEYEPSVEAREDNLKFLARHA